MVSVLASFSLASKGYLFLLAWAGRARLSLVGKARQANTGIKHAHACYIGLITSLFA